MKPIIRLFALAIVIYLFVFAGWSTALLVSGQVQYPGVPPPAGYNDMCEADKKLYDYFGPYCLHPVYWDIPNYVPRGQAIGFRNPETGQNDIGRVSAYYWQNGEYVYLALTTPSSDLLQLRYVLVRPSELIPLPQLP